MALLKITEFTAIGSAVSTSVPIAALPPVAEQSVDFSAGVTQSSALDRKTTYVRLLSDVDCCIAVGNDPTATTSNLQLVAGEPEYFGAQGGYKISVIALS